MNRESLIRGVAGHTGLSQRAVRSVLNASLEAIAKALVSRERVMLIGFGTFGVARCRAHKITHPVTGEPMWIEAKTVPVFRPGRRLRGEVDAKRRPGRPRKQ